MFPSLEIWAWLLLSHTQTMGVVVRRAPLLKFLEITTALPHPTSKDRAG